MNNKARVEELLTKEFTPRHLSVDDLSDLHKKHKEARLSGGGHYQIVVVSDAFNGRNHLSRHRLVYQALKELMPHSIHAISIQAFTLKEYEMKNSD